MKIPCATQTLTFRKMLTLKHRWKYLMVAQKAYLLLGLWLILQLLAATVIFFTSRKFHESYGFWGTADQYHQQCSSGYEWYATFTGSAINANSMKGTNHCASCDLGDWCRSLHNPIH